MKGDKTPSVRFDFRYHKVYINKATLQKLGNPKYLELLYGSEKMLLISGNNEKTLDSYIVPQAVYETSRSECAINRKILTEAFRLRLGFNKTTNFKVNGAFSPNIGMVVFDLNTGIVLSEK